MWLVNGADDHHMMRDEACFVAAARHGRRLVFDGADHGVSMRRPVAFAQLINRFVAEVAAR